MLEEKVAQRKASTNLFQISLLLQNTLTASRIMSAKWCCIPAPGQTRACSSLQGATITTCLVCKRRLRNEQSRPSGASTRAARTCAAASRPRLRFHSFERGIGVAGGRAAVELGADFVVSVEDPWVRPNDHPEVRPREFEDAHPDLYREIHVVGDLEGVVPLDPHACGLRWCLVPNELRARGSCLVELPRVGLMEFRSCWISRSIERVPY